MAKFTNNEVREVAKNTQKGNVLIAILAIIAVNAVITALSVTGFGTIAVFVFYGLIGTMMASLFIAIARGKKAELKDITNGANNFVGAIVTGMLVQVFTLLWTLLLIVPGIIKGLSYSQALYLIADGKETEANAAIKRSRELMNGNKMQLFCLYLSFIPRMLLVILTFGIYGIWALPYFETASAAFYNKLVEDEDVVEVAQA